jgi:hypothetical protein
MPEPTFGKPGGQKYDVARAIHNFLAQMAEGGGNQIAGAVVKELLQNADDANATEFIITLDERTPPKETPSEYAGLTKPALLVHNNARFRLSNEVEEPKVDDFTALCDVASGHKHLHATAAGRFGIGFNSVYFLTDTPVIFSRRKIHVFDLYRHLPFKDDGWQFSLDDYPSDSQGSGGPIKSLLEWSLPKVAMVSDQSLGLLANDPNGDYTKTLFRLPLRQSAEGIRTLWSNSYPTREDRRKALLDMVVQAARTAVFLKSLSSLRFNILDDDGVQTFSEISLTPPSPELSQFIKRVGEEAELVGGNGETYVPGQRLECKHERREVRWDRPAHGDKEAETLCWKFDVNHIAPFESPELTDLRSVLKRNDEKAVPWAAIAVPLNIETLRIDGDEQAAWRVFLPLLEEGPSALIFHGAFFVGPSRQCVEFLEDGSDESLRKTNWNKELVSNAIVPLLSDLTLVFSEMIPEMLENNPKEYLSLFPNKAPKSGSSQTSLTAYLAQRFAAVPWLLRVLDLWGNQVEIWVDDGSITVGDDDTSDEQSLELVPEWLAAYRDRFCELAMSSSRYFIPNTLGKHLKDRVDAPKAFRHRVNPDVARAVLSYEQPPEMRDLEKLLQLLDIGKTNGSDALDELWAFISAEQDELLRYYRDDLYILEQDGPAKDLSRALNSLELLTQNIEWVKPDMGLPNILGHRDEISNILAPDQKAGLEMLCRIQSGDRHERFPRPDVLQPVIDFLLEIDPGRIPEDLKLGFLVRTATDKEQRRKLGVILLRPESPSENDNALWEGLFRPAFAEVDSNFARSIYPLLNRHPELIERMHAPDCRVAIADTKNSMRILHEAWQVDRQAAVDAIGASLKKAALDKWELATTLILEAAADSWEEFDEDRRLVVLALPIHRCASGEHVSLVDLAGKDLNQFANRFQIQSNDDLQEAPITLPDAKLLQCHSSKVKGFYRTLGIRERGQVTLLKEVLQQIGDQDAPNEDLLDYIERYYLVVVDRLEHSSNVSDRDDANELINLFNKARIVLCLDGTWHAADDCTDGQPIERSLSRHKWPKKCLPGLVSALLYGRKVAVFSGNSAKIVRRLVELKQASADDIAIYAIESESPSLSLEDRAKLILAYQADLSKPDSNPKPASAVLELELPVMDGRDAVADAKIISGSTYKDLGPSVLKVFVSNAVDENTAASELDCSPADLRVVLNALGVETIDEKSLTQSIVGNFSSTWESLPTGERLRLLTYIGKKNLEDTLSADAQHMEVALVDGGADNWVRSENVLSPEWADSNPPLLRDDQIPNRVDVLPSTVKVWNKWNGLQTFSDILKELVESATSMPIKSRREAAKKIYKWIEHVLEKKLVQSDEFAQTLSTQAWILSMQGDLFEFKRPADVLLGEAAPVFGFRFWVEDTRVPKRLIRILEEDNVTFRTSLPATNETIKAMVKCLDAKILSVAFKTAIAAYQEVDKILNENEDLFHVWDAESAEQAVFRLFRKSDRTVPGWQIFLGEESDSPGDFGDSLFAFCAPDDQPSEIRELYRKLGVQGKPTSRYAFKALAEFAASGDLKTYARLVNIAVKGAEDVVTEVHCDGLKVMACSGEFVALDSCYHHPELGRKEYIAPDSQHLLLDASRQANKYLVGWLEENSPGTVQMLSTHGERHISTPPRATSPTNDQILAPWNEWLGEINRDDAVVRVDLGEQGFVLPEHPIELVPVNRLSLSYTLPDGTIVSPSKDWAGPRAAHDGNGLIFVRSDEVELSDSSTIDSLDKAITLELSDLLGREGPRADLKTLQDLVSETLERPSAVLERCCKDRMDHLIYQYHDQVADPDFAKLFERYQKSHRDSKTARKLLDKMTDIWQSKFVSERRKQIRGYGYDEFSIFAELVQNADDAYLQASSLGMSLPDQCPVRFRYESADDRITLIAEHHGRPFNYWRHNGVERPEFRHDVEGVLRSAGSFKPPVSTDSDKPAVGRFGLGFKSVFLISDIPRIYSGLWNFEIESGCLPRELSRPKDFPEDTTGIHLPLRSEDLEEMDDDGERLLDLVPFLRHVRQLGFENSDKSSREIVIEIEPRTPHRSDGVFCELVTVRGAKHLQGGEASFYRLSNENHQGQLGILLAQDGLASSWDEAFDHDFFTVLPLKAKTGCGVAVSHLFEVQSGRTHLIDPEANKFLGQEVASLLVAIPELILGSSDGVDQALDSFWLIWKWDRGDSETEDIRQFLAAALVELANNDAILPTWDPDSPVSMGSTPLVYFPSGIPSELVEKLINAKLWLPLENNPEEGFSLSAQKVLKRGSATAYKRACHAAGIDPPKNQPTPIGWERVGSALVDSDYLKPTIASTLGRVAKDSPHSREKILSWLPDCNLKGSDGGQKDLNLKPESLVRGQFPGIEDLPMRLLTLLDDSYEEDAINLLLEAGLRERPNELEISKCIKDDQLSIEESLGILRYLLGDKRYQDPEYRELNTIVGTSWFGPNKISLKEAKKQDKIPKDLLEDRMFREWLGLSETTPEPTPPPPVLPSPPDPAEVLEALYEWWQENGAEWTQTYERELYPDQRVFDLSSDFSERDRRERAKWISLLILGMSHSFRHSERGHHRNLLQRCIEDKWIDVFAEPVIKHDEWFQVLEDYLDQDFGDPKYYHWMATSFVRIYQICRWLPKYVTAFLHMDRSEREFSFDEVMRTRESALFQQTDISAPPLTKPLGMGSHFVVRELVRTRVLKNPKIHRHAFLAQKPVREILERIGCEGLSKDDHDNNSVTIHQFLVEHLGKERSTFDLSFDLPLQALARKDFFLNSELKAQLYPPSPPAPSSTQGDWVTLPDGRKFPRY